MKNKILMILTIIFSAFILTSCITDDETIKVIAPSGTPALGLADYFSNTECDYEITNGSEALVAAFTSSSHDIIVAPVNLGAKFYNQTKGYKLAFTFVWGNLYIASTQEVTSLEDLSGKKLVAFGKNSTPDIVLKAINNAYPDLNIEIEYVGDVATANSLLVSGSVEYIVSAEPSLSKIKGVKTIYTIDLQTEWQKIYGVASYPQAGVFVKASKASNAKVTQELRKIKASVELCEEDAAGVAEKAVSIHASFANLGSSVLEKAIPNCHFALLEKDQEKQAVIDYLSFMLENGFAPQVGGILPDEKFFI